MSNGGFLPNMSLLAKADLALSDLTSGGGILQPETAQSFMRILIEDSRLMKMSTVVPMKSQKMEIPKIRFLNRLLRAGAEGTALPAGDRQKPTVTNVELDTKLFKAEVRLPNEVLEDNIERDQLKNTIMQLMGEGIARDVDDIMINGDTTSADPFYAQFNGILTQSVTNTVDAALQTLNKSVLKDMLKSMPRAFLRNKDLLRFLTSVHAEIDYRDTIASRQTPGGDAFLTNGGATATYTGVPVLDIPMFPESLGSGTNCTDVVLSDPKNATLGIWREIRMETDKDVSAGVVVIVASMRMDMKWAEETATVKAFNVKVSG